MLTYFNRTCLFVNSEDLTLKFTGIKNTQKKKSNVRPSTGTCIPGCNSSHTARHTCNIDINVQVSYLNFCSQKEMHILRYNTLYFVSLPCEASHISSTDANYFLHHLRL